MWFASQANPQESSCRTCGWPNETKPSYVLPKYRPCFWYTALTPKIWLLEKCWIFVVQSPTKLINRRKWLQAATLHDIPMQVTTMEKLKYPYWIGTKFQFSALQIKVSDCQVSLIWTTFRLSYWTFAWRTCKLFRMAKMKPNISNATDRLSRKQKPQWCRKS